MTILAIEDLRRAAPIDAIIYGLAFETFEGRALFSIGIDSRFHFGISRLLDLSQEAEVIVDFEFGGVRELAFSNPRAVTQPKEARRPYEYEIASWSVRKHRIRRFTTLEIHCFSGQRFFFGFESVRLTLSDRRVPPLQDEAAPPEGPREQA